MLVCYLNFLQFSFSYCLSRASALHERTANVLTVYITHKNWFLTLILRERRKRLIAFSIWYQVSLISSFIKFIHPTFKSMPLFLPFMHLFVCTPNIVQKRLCIASLIYSGKHVYNLFITWSKKYRSLSIHRFLIVEEVVEI